jgi:uncharacterized protein (TIGR00251 family)
MAESPFTRTGDGVVAVFRLTPKSSANAIRGVARDADGSVHIKAAVTAAPEGGKANAALLKLLAKTWKLPKTSLTIVSGATSRRKVVHIAGDPAALYEALEEWGRKIQ